MNNNQKTKIAAIVSIFFIEAMILFCTYQIHFANNNKIIYTIILFISILIIPTSISSWGNHKDKSLTTLIKIFFMIFSLSILSYLGDSFFGMNHNSSVPFYLVGFESIWFYFTTLPIIIISIIPLLNLVINILRHIILKILKINQKNE